MFKKLINRISINGTVFENISSIKVADRQVFIDGKPANGIDITSDKLHVVVQGDLATLTCDGPATVNGDISGNASAGGSIKCGDITGRADAGGSISSNDIYGDVDAGGSVTSKSVGGDINAGGSVTIKR